MESGPTTLIECSTDRSREGRFDRDRQVYNLSVSPVGE